MVKHKLAESFGKLIHLYTCSGTVCVVCSVMVENQVQSVGDYFHERVDTLIHEMHSCKLGEQMKLVCVCVLCVDVSVCTASCEVLDLPTPSPLPTQLLACDYRASLTV